jgi:hypothetical protein
LLSNCREKAEGCLDIKAKNFSVSADASCSACCTYPSLTIGWDTANFPRNKKFLVTNGDSCEILSWKILFSEFQLTSSDNVVSRISDSVLLVRNADSSRQINDFGILSFDKFAFTQVGTFRQAGNFKRLQFTVGLSDFFNKTNAKRMGNVPTLASTSDLYVDATDGYANQIVRLKRKIGTVTDTVNVVLKRPNSSFFVVDLQQNFKLKEGADGVIPLKINLMQLMNNLNIRNTDSLKAQWNRQFVGALSL